MAPRLATQQAKSLPSKSTTTWDAYEPVPTGHEPLLVPVMLGGQPTGANADLAAAQARFEDDLGRLPATARALQDARPPPVRLSEQLEGLRERVRAQLPHRDRPAQP